MATTSRTVEGIGSARRWARLKNNDALVFTPTGVPFKIERPSSSANTTCVASAGSWTSEIRSLPARGKVATTMCSTKPSSSAPVGTSSTTHWTATCLLPGGGSPSTCTRRQVAASVPGMHRRDLAR